MNLSTRDQIAKLDFPTSKLTENLAREEASNLNTEDVTMHTAHLRVTIAGYGTMA
jgi:hypothetical protein